MAPSLLGCGAPPSPSHIDNLYEPHNPVRPGLILALQVEPRAQDFLSRSRWSTRAGSTQFGGRIRRRPEGREHALLKFLILAIVINSTSDAAEDAAAERVRGRRAFPMAVQFVGPDVVEIETNIDRVSADLFSLVIGGAHLRFYGDLS